MYKLSGFVVYGDHEEDPGGLSIKLFPIAISSYPWWSKATKAVLREMHKLPIEGATVLDLGCGASAILALAAEKLGAYAIVACEHNLAQIDTARIQLRGKNIQLIEKDDGKEYDIIIANIGEASIIDQLEKRSKHGICTSKEGEILRW